MKDSENLIKTGVKNTFYLIFAELISCALSFLTSFVLPGLLGVSAYGYYQVYAFYTSYVGIMHFGFNDGIYLRFGKFEYDRLPKKMFRSFVDILFWFQTVLALGFIVATFFESDSNRRFAFIFAAINIVVLNLSCMFNYVNQVTNRIRKFSFVVIAEKLQIIISILVLLCIGNRNFKAVVLADFSAKLAVLIINLYNCREIIFGRRMPYRRAIPQSLRNIDVGIKLMFANLMGMLVMGIGRFMLERFGTISEFGLYSFAVSSINLAMIFITSVSLILYPILCRVEREELPRIYVVMNKLLCSSIFFMLLLYYPLVFVINHWLTKYTPVLQYLYLLFPIVIMQSKIEMLVNTYYKSLREEKAMLRANLSSVLMFLILAVPLFWYYRSVQVIVWVTFLTFAWRCYASEVFLKKKMKLTDFHNIPQEIAMALAFILSTGVMKGILGFTIYFLSASAFLFINRKTVIHYGIKAFQSVFH